MPELELRSYFYFMSSYANYHMYPVSFKPKISTCVETNSILHKIYPGERKTVLVNFSQVAGRKMKQSFA